MSFLQVLSCVTFDLVRVLFTEAFSDQVFFNQTWMETRSTRLVLEPSESNVDVIFDDICLRTF